MSNLAHLRALAAQKIKPFAYPICLEHAARLRVDDAMAALVDLRTRLSNLSDEAESESLGKRSPRATLERAIVKAEGELQAADDAAKGSSVVLVFRWLEPDERPALVVEATGADGQPRMLDLYRATARASYERSESADGEDLEWGFDEAWRLANSGDRQNIYVALVDADLTAQTVPFDRANSGVPATSSQPA